MHTILFVRFINIAVRLPLHAGGERLELLNRTAAVCG